MIHPETGTEIRLSGYNRIATTTYIYRVSGAAPISIWSTPETRFTPTRAHVTFNAGTLTDVRVSGPRLDHPDVETARVIPPSDDFTAIGCGWLSALLTEPGNDDYRNLTVYPPNLLS